MKAFCKHIILITLPALLLTAAFSCDNSRGHSLAAAGTDSIETPHDRAFRYRQENRPFEEQIEQQLLAVEQLRAGQPLNDPVDILSQAGHLYMRHGDYLKALMYMQEAADTLDARSREGQPDFNSIKLHGSLSGLLHRIGLNQEALAENALGLETSRAFDNRLASDLWRFRGAIYKDMAQRNPYNRDANIDSAAYGYDMAVAILSHMPRSSEEDKAKCRRWARYSKAELFINFPDRFRDSLPVARAILEDGIRNENTYGFAYTNQVLLGHTLVLQGNYRQGLELMESGLESFRNEDDKESVDWALKELADAYVVAGQADRLAAIYPELTQIQDTLVNDAKTNAVVGAEFRYRLNETRQQAERLAQEKSQARRIALYEGLALLIGIIAGAVLMWLGARRIRKVQIEKERQQLKIDEILSHQQKLNATIEELNLRLANSQSEEIIEKAAVSLDPTLLSGEDENEFRRAFNKLHPNFLGRLRADYPSLTPNDELVCMMIYLKKPSIDIALCLGISRPSLNSLRYRIRKKMGLDKETDLDTFIASR